jgi:hypothetical protein
VIIAVFPFDFVWQSKGLRSAQETEKRREIRRNPHSSLAVFYVEQVALNRHDLFQYGSENKVGCNRVNNFLEKFLQPS